MFLIANDFDTLITNLFFGGKKFGLGVIVIIFQHDIKDNRVKL